MVLEVAASSRGVVPSCMPSGCLDVEYAKERRELECCSSLAYSQPD